MYNSETEKISFTIAESLRGVVAYGTIYPKSIALAYLAYKSSDQDFYSNYDSVGKIGFNFAREIIEDYDLSNFVLDTLRDVPIDAYVRLQSFPKDELRDFILNAEDSLGRATGEFSTPDSLIDLSLSILNINNDEKVLDNCAGTASFLTKGYMRNPYAKYYGVELNTDATAVAKIRSSVLGGNIEISQGDALLDNYGDIRFDKVFSNYPFGMQVRNLNNAAFHIDQIKRRCPEMSKATSSDWIFNYKLVNMLNEFGTGVAIMTPGGLWNTIDKPVREFFVKNSYIKAVIALPAKLFASTAMPVAIVVFGKQMSKEVRIIDATKVFTEGRRSNTLSAENIATIVQALEVDSDIAKSVTVAEIVQNDFVMMPTRYFANTVSIENGVEFGSLIKTITRGAPYTAQDLDNLVSKEPTNYQYLMLSNIKNGVIDEELPYLKEIDERYERFCVHNGNILLSKNGYPFKVAVAIVAEDKKLLANGNLFVIELDETLIKPYYLKAFLESEKGIALLKSIAVGASMPNIGLEQLKRILIPMIPMEEQVAVETKYLAVLDEISLLKRKISKAESSLKSLFDAE